MESHKIDVPNHQPDFVLPWLLSVSIYPPVVSSDMVDFPATVDCHRVFPANIPHSHSIHIPLISPVLSHDLPMKYHHESRYWHYLNQVNPRFSHIFGTSRTLSVSGFFPLEKPSIPMGKPSRLGPVRTPRETSSLFRTER